MAIQIGDPQPGNPPVEGVYVVRIRIAWGEMFAWWDGANWSKPYRSAGMCLDDLPDQVGHRLQRNKIGSVWNGVVSWRTYSDPPRFPVVQPAPDDGGKALVDLLKQAMAGKQGG